MRNFFKVRFSLFLSALVILSFVFYSFATDSTINSTRPSTEMMGTRVTANSGAVGSSMAIDPLGKIQGHYEGFFKNGEKLTDNKITLDINNKTGSNRATMVVYSDKGNKPMLEMIYDVKYDNDGNYIFTQHNKKQYPENIKTYEDNVAVNYLAYDLKGSLDQSEKTFTANVPSWSGIPKIVVDRNINTPGTNAMQTPKPLSPPTDVTSTVTPVITSNTPIPTISTTKGSSSSTNSSNPSKNLFALIASLFAAILALIMAIIKKMI